MNILSRIYANLSYLERRFFEIFSFLTLRPKARVISIGNLSMGGTGKTPVLFELLSEFQEISPSKSVVVLTRGYRCPWEKSFFQLKGRGNHPFELTDEALMLNSRFPGIPILVGKNRHHAAILGELRFKPDLFLLDDGFQYRRIAKDFNILLWDAMSKPEEAAVLPEGRLREPIERLKQADVILLTRCESASPEQITSWTDWLKDKSESKPVIKTKNLCEGIFKVDGKPSELRNTDILAFSAIGRPESFYSQLEISGFKIKVKKEFRDHHRFTDNELKDLVDEAKKQNLPLICTEKDAIKIKQNIAEKMNLNILKIKTIPLSGKTFLQEFELAGLKNGLSED